MPKPQNPSRIITIQVRRRPLYEWLGWLIWLIILAVLFEFAVKSLLEYERQAGITAGALFLFLLVAGVIVEAVQQVESRSPYRQYDKTEPPEEPKA